ncbi:MAG: hypothetical protein AAFR33_15380 [Pseudomonadota bacterium]
MLKFLFSLLFVGVVAGEFYILFTGDQVAVWQSKVMQGDPVSALGNNPAEYDMLVCRHFDGRQVIVSLYSYAEDDVGGFSQCPLLIREEDALRMRGEA